MKTLTVEIRDRATKINAVAIKPGHPSNSTETLAMASWNGYNLGNNEIILIRLSDAVAQDRVQNWEDRTMYNAHKFIQANFEKLSDGDVIDVEFILGETQKKKTAEWKNHMREIL